MAHHTRKPKDRVIEIAVEKQSATTEIHVRLHLPSAWINRAASVLISLLLVVFIAYHPVVTPESIKYFSHLMGA